MNWFDVDPKGLAKLVADRGKVFVIRELLQNAWDAGGVGWVSVSLAHDRRRHKATLIVFDDSPDGFVDLDHAWTLFAESRKKADPSKRGRFNLGEKLVLALCDEAEIRTTTGQVIFDADGTRRGGRSRTKKGSEFRAILPMTRAEFDEVGRRVRRVIPPPGVLTTYNGEALTGPPAAAQFEATLPTLVADDRGILRRTMRRTSVCVYEPPAGESAAVFEMGIPVVETGDAFDVDVGQKVPLTLDRENLPPAYLRALRVEVLNHTAHRMTPERAASVEVQEASGDPRCAPAAVAAMLDRRFGEKRFTFDPSDPEANGRLVASGYSPIQGGSLSAGQWANVKQHGLSKPAGELAPSPRPYSEGGRTQRLVASSEWTEGMRRVADWSIRLGSLLLDGRTVVVRIALEPQVYWAANYGCGEMTFNLGKLGHRFFDGFPGNLAEVLELLIHEFGHEYSPDHLSDEYHRALCRIGARAVLLGLDRPECLRGP